MRDAVLAWAATYLIDRPRSSWRYVRIVYIVLTMPKRLTRSGNSLALVIDKPLLEALDIDTETDLEVSTDGDVLVISPVRKRRRRQKLKELVAEAHERYGGVFKRLSE
jgi:antitoxin MazE